MKKIERINKIREDYKRIATALKMVQQQIDLLCNDIEEVIRKPEKK